MNKVFGSLFSLLAVLSLPHAKLG